jgi:hypothetical protein
MHPMKSQKLKLCFNLAKFEQITFAEHLMSCDKSCAPANDKPISTGETAALNVFGRAPK